ncbi:DUF6682 family protein, partial [Desulfobacter sp.]|uniref:phage adaptor protein n=1 Tax=Desulfobacter sp. TaxID=2294 RepID=UPI003D0FAAE4
FDPENPRVFWVHPKPSLPFAIELIYSKLPEQFTEESTCLSVSDIYITSLYEWVMYRCYSMEGKGMDMGEASIHLNNFYNIMGIKKQNEILLQQVQENT